MVEECSETRIHGLYLKISKCPQARGLIHLPYRVGWKAMPLAREDLDSNLVSIEGEAIVPGSARLSELERGESDQGEAVINHAA